MMKRGLTTFVAHDVRRCNGRMLGWLWFNITRYHRGGRHTILRYRTCQPSWQCQVPSMTGFHIRIRRTRFVIHLSSQPLSESLSLGDLAPDKNSPNVGVTHNAS